jgi:hypothetical protein
MDLGEAAGQRHAIRNRLYSSPPAG